MLRFAFLLSLAACFTKRVETVSQPRTLLVRVTAQCEATATFEQYRDGYHAVPLDHGTADIDVPELSGGYSERGGHTFDKHDPWDAPMLRLRHGDHVVRELSIHQIDALDHDPAGRAIVDC